MSIWDMLNQIVAVPQWYLVAIGLCSVLVSMVCYLVASHISYKWSLPKVAVVDKSVSENYVADAPVSKEKKVDFALISSPATAYKPVPPLRQHYWYRVSGVSGRFATLREALAASGVKVPDNKMLDWKKLSAVTRAKINRVKVGEEQPVDTEVAAVGVGLQPVAPPEVMQKSVSEVAPDTIVKSLGDGSYVTFKKKPK